MEPNRLVRVHLVPFAGDPLGDPTLRTNAIVCPVTGVSVSTENAFLGRNTHFVQSV